MLLAVSAPSRHGAFQQIPITECFRWLTQCSPTASGPPAVPDRNLSFLRFSMQSDSLDPNSNKCLRQTSDGRTCRMLRKKGHPSFCIHHAREEQQRLESEKLAAEFASLSGKL